MELTIAPPKPTEELAEGRTLVAIVLHSILLAPCNSILFRMLLGASQTKFERSGIEAIWSGLFGMHCAVCVAEVQDRQASIEAAKALVNEMNIADSVYIGYFEKAEGAWRMAHAGAAGWNLPFDSFTTEARRSECLKIMAEENAFTASVTDVARRKSEESQGDNA